MAQTITDRIVNLTAQVVVAPSPSQLQQSGAIISIGGTALAAGSYQYCGDLATLDATLNGAGNSTELTNMGTTFFTQGTGVGLYILELGLIANVNDQITALQTWITANPNVFYSYLVPVDWDSMSEEVGSVLIGTGTYTYSAAPTVTFTAATGGGVTATATATINASGHVTAITITNPGWYPNQTAPTATLSIATTGTAPTLTVVMTNGMATLANNYTSATGKTYFFVTTTTTGVASYSPQKSVIATVAAPTAVSTEFAAASLFYQYLVNNPRSATPLAPLSYRYIYGLTPWVRMGNKVTINSILTAYGNIVLTGAEGGISNSCIFKGMTMDGSQASWWYGIDWFQIQVAQALAAAIINGSNMNPPLLYNQVGINTLQKVAQTVANNAVTFGCALSAVVNATSFANYTSQNPNDYKAGIYDGLSATVVGQNGFLTITFNLTAVQFAV